MKIIMGAETFTGFVVQGASMDTLFTAVFIEITDGSYSFQTSDSEEVFSEGDEFIFVDVASCVSNSSLTTATLCSNPIEAIIIRVLHELSHWAGGKHEQQCLFESYQWDCILSSLHKEGSVKNEKILG